MWKKLALICLAITIVAPQEFLENKPDQVAEKRILVETLVYHDYFWNCTGGKPDPKSWGYEKGFVRNHEPQYYTTENVKCGNGLLTITAEKVKPNRNKFGGAKYTSTSLTSRGKQEFQYGRFLMKGKIDVRPGSWPAFWTLGTNIGSYNWPQCGEIDIMEFMKGTTLQNIWYVDKSKGKTNHNRWIGNTGTNSTWAQEFHTWEMIWNRKTIQLLQDGRVSNFIDIYKTQRPGVPNPFQQKVWMIINQAINDNTEDPNKTQFPLKYEVKKVEIFQSVKVSQETCVLYCAQKASNGCCEYQEDEGFCVWYGGGVPNKWSTNKGWRSLSCKDSNCDASWQQTTSCIANKEI